MSTMIATHIRHGDLVIDMDSCGDVQIVRQSTGQAIRLSLTEWNYLCQIAELHGWPIAPPIHPVLETP